MDLDSVADELYRASPDEFVERRKQQAAAARAAKDRDLAKAVLALRRPTRSAWLVNLLAHGAPTEVSALLELGTALADAQRRGSGPDLRELSRQRHTTIEALTRQAVSLAADQGHAATEATRQEVSQTLQAALADGEVADLVRAGRVVQAASYGGFGPLDLFAAAPAPATQALPEVAESPARAHSAPSPESPAEGEGAPAVGPDAAPSPVDEEAERARWEAESAVRSATEGLEEARRLAEEAETAAQEQTSRADELADQVDSLRTQLSDAEAAERQAQDEARAARRAGQQAQRAVSEAEQALHEAEAELTRLAAD
ncbi:MAG TPA: hypothetical protein VF642_02040 [Propionibacteriaceae bacterium]